MISVSPRNLKPAPAPSPHNPDLRLHSQFRSKYLKTARDLIVCLPPEYDLHPERRYPVLYLQDGQNLFDPDTAFVRGMDWRADETARALTQQRAIEPLIMVGIYNTGKRRIDEYTPTRDPKVGGGRADAYGRMLVSEIKPFIDAQYRTLPGPANTALGGSSLGGLVTLYLGLMYPQVFGKLAALSPSVWWNQQWIVRRVTRARSKPQLTIWLDIGTAEGEKTLRDARALHDALLAKGWVDGDDLHYQEFVGANHSEAAWAQRVAPMLQYLFPLPDSGSDSRQSGGRGQKAPRSLLLDAPFPTDRLR